MIGGYREFEFDLPGALLANLVRTLDQIAAIPLTMAHVGEIPDEQGIYQLFLDGLPVYVGKTDAEAGLLKRLTRHSRKVQHRKHLAAVRVSFKAVRIFVFTAVDMESDLIRHYGGVSGLAWNGSGFGSNDPGRERDTTKNKPENYDYQYPIDVDLGIKVSIPAGTVKAAFDVLNKMVPYTIRRQRHSDMNTLVPEIGGSFTAREAISMLVSRLPAGWQATKLLGYIIVYKEDKVYPDMEIVARS